MLILLIVYLNMKNVFKIILPKVSSSSFKFLITSKNRNLFSFPKYNFSRMIDFNSLSADSVNVMIDGLISNINNTTNNKYNTNNIIQSLGLLMGVTDKEILKQAKDSLLSVIKNQKFMNNINKVEFLAIFTKSYLLDLEKEDLEFLEDLYLEFNKSEIENNSDSDSDSDNVVFSIDEKLNLLDSIYYYEKNSFHLNIIKDDLNKFFIENILKLKPEQIILLLKTILFMNDEDILVYTPKVIEYMNKIIKKDEKPKNMDYLMDKIVYFPKILSATNDKEIYNLEMNKLRNFIIQNMDYNLNPETMICLISNFCNYLNFSTSLLEIYMPYFYRNLGGLDNEFFIELFFLYLQSDLKKYKNPENITTFLNELFNLIKNVNTKPRQTNEMTKELLFFNDTRNKLKNSLNEWKEKTAKIEEIPKEYHLIFVKLIEKSIDLFPFAAEEYNVKLLDKIFKNFLDSIKI
jgi:hypothetical protein